MKATSAIITVGLILLLFVILTFGFVKATKELTQTIAAGISNMYSTVE